MSKKITIIVSLFIFCLLSITIFLFFNGNNSNQLLDTTWRVVSFNGEKINDEVLLTIDSDSVGFQICNNIGYGKVKITKDKIYFHAEPYSTMMACDEPLMSLESSFLSTFSEPFNYVIENGDLILTNGRNKVVFTVFNPLPIDFDTSLIEDVQARHEDSIMNVPGVVGVGIGECNGQLCLKVFLEEETPESKNIPSEIEGFQLEKEITGPIEIFQEEGNKNELDL